MFPSLPAFYTTVRNYGKLSDLANAGSGILLRPWMMTFHHDAGFKGICDPVRASDRI